MPTSIGPGDVLADRYRLDDLLSESSGGRFWRAYDRVLSRNVAVHVIAASDPRSDALMDAARRSAVLLDRRILRVLDADRRTDVNYVVNEWGEGTSLDILLESGPLESDRAAWITYEVGSAIAGAHAAGLTHGRLNPENVLLDVSGSVRLIGFAVDAALAGLPPASVAQDVTDLGAILYAGLTGRWPGVSHSPRVPPAPREGSAMDAPVLHARQVRAGIPAALDAICDGALGERIDHGRGAHARADYDLSTARGVTDALRRYLGDPAAHAAIEVGRARGVLTVPVLPPEVPTPLAPLASDDPDETAERPLGAAPVALVPTFAPADPIPADPVPAASPEVDSTVVDAPAIDTPAIDTPAAHSAASDSTMVDAPVVEPPAPPAMSPAPIPSPSPSSPTPPAAPSAAPSARVTPAESADQATQAGMPIFYDDDHVDWLNAEPVSPPPVLPEPVPKPLFAPDPPEGQPTRRPRLPSSVPTSTTGHLSATPAGASPATTAGGTASGTASGEFGGTDVGSPAGVDFWPWGDPPSSGASLPVVQEAPEMAPPGRMWLRVAGGIAVALLLLLATAVALNRGNGLLGGQPPAPAESSTETIPASRIPPTGVVDLDPFGSPKQEENRGTVGNTIDRNRDTAWSTNTYAQQFGPGGLKPGLGLRLDLGRSYSVSRIEVRFATGPADFSVYVTEEPASDPTGLDAVAELSGGPLVKGSLDPAVTGRYVTIWLTRLPPAADQFRAEISEVSVFGT